MVYGARSGRFVAGAVPNLGRLSGMPATWLNPQVDGLLLRFVDSAFAGDATLQEQARALFVPLQHFATTPLSLREISKALMRATREEN